MFLVPLTPASRASSELARSFERLFDDSFERLTGYAGDGARSPAIDVAETPAGYSVWLEVPGVAKQDIKIAIDGRRVSITAQAQRDDSKKGEERLVYRERSTAAFARSFTLPEEIDQDASQARLDNGVLTLALAKKRAAAARQLAVN
jgi:HSP20 family protein